MEPGYMALSIYCAHMSSKWSRILDSRPIQGKDMSAEVYYDQFCNWKKKLEEVNYMGDEGSYIDDFLYGLRMDLAIRVWGYKWKPCTLYGAFRRAEMEETMLSWKELPRENDVDKVFEEMSKPNSVNITEALEAEGVPDEKRNGVWKLLDSEEETENEITYDQEDSGPGDLENEEDDFLHLMADNSLVEMVGQSFSSKPEVVEDAHYMFDKMLHPVPVSLTLDLGYDATEAGSIYGSYKSRLGGVTMVTKATFGKRVGENEARYKFEDMSHPNSVGVVKAQGDRSILNILCSFKLRDITALSGVDQKDIGFGAMGVKVVHDSLFPDTMKGMYGTRSSNAMNKLCLFRIHAIELETYECKYAISFNDIEEMFYFDPGGCSLSQMCSDPVEFNGEKGEFGLTLIVVDTLIKAIKHKCKDVILLIVDAVMFYFDPGGCHLPQIGCDPFELYSKHGYICLELNVDVSLIKAKEYCAVKDFNEQWYEIDRLAHEVLNVLIKKHVMTFPCVLDDKCGVIFILGIYLLLEGHDAALSLGKENVELAIVIPHAMSQNALLGRNVALQDSLSPDYNDNIIKVGDLFRDEDLRVRYYICGLRTPKMLVLDVIEDMLKTGCNTLGLKASYLIWGVRTFVLFWLINQKCKNGHTFRDLNYVCTYCLTVDGIIVEVHYVNIMLETHGGACCRSGSTWASPMASITIRNHLFYTTNKSWQVKILKDTREFSNNKGFIYLFKKLKRVSLSNDLLPHLDMLIDADITYYPKGPNMKILTEQGNDWSMKGMVKQFAMVERTWHVILVDLREKEIRLVLILIDRVEAIHQECLEPYVILLKQIGLIVDFQAGSMRELKTKTLVGKCYTSGNYGCLKQIGSLHSFQGSPVYIIELVLRLIYLIVGMIVFAMLEHFVRDPALIWNFYFTTLRTRRLLRGRICHVPRLKFRIFFFEI